ncbi:maleylpyruvate isomerase family mycothiol-dependent enzyme [Actinomadura fulvescens]|uniref:Maleylpyruvate isomerase family mycothiol-dependent enzyme n=1 Tax=Actinomadura fulvescens TaxID=46160 RepID=A0ABP6C1E5_9ACTN
MAMNGSGAADRPADWERVPNHVLYRRIRHDVARLVADRPDAAVLPVPACPEWTVRDLVDHLADVCTVATRRLTTGEFVRPGRVPTPGAPALPRLLDSWAERGERLDELVAASTDRLSDVLVMDAFTHELDLRHALGSPPPAGHPAYPGMLDFVANAVLAQVSTLGLPPLEIVTPGARWTNQGERPAVTLAAADRHDLYRTLTGRRTHEQIAALSWSRDPGAWLPAFSWGPFTPPATPVEEPTHGRKHGRTAHGGQVDTGQEGASRDR